MTAGGKTLYALLEYFECKAFAEKMCCFLITSHTSSQKSKGKTQQPKRCTWTGSVKGKEMTKTTTKTKTKSKRYTHMKRLK